MAQINIKLTEEQKSQIQEIAKEKGLTVTQLVITSILDKEVLYTKNEDFYTKVDRIEDDIDGIENRIENDSIGIENSIYKELYEVLLKQIEQKDTQIDQLHKIIYNKDTLLIEDQKKRNIGGNSGCLAYRK
ncbi:hypothetical protein SMI10712_01954 [Streptococcus mitis]|uniref:Uncharacterized protein n=1 Tax=Streptococcus mitis TaxID=28037 RepID=A0A150NIN0_STRMT|nr:hypothetical protein SMI10712_01954 [Streptococcus mitis]